MSQLLTVLIPRSRSRVREFFLPTEAVPGQLEAAHACGAAGI